MDSWLAISYGAAYTRAVLVWPDGSRSVLSFDGGFELSSAVHVSPQETTVGAAAWRQAAAAPEGFVVSSLRAGADQVLVDGAQVEVADLVAATLRRVAGEAARVAQGPVSDVRIVVPAGWGPRRRTWLRQAARKAGLPLSRLVEAPVAVANRLDPADGVSPMVVLVLDVGAGCEVSVLKAGGAGLEVLSTLADPTAGGDRIDEALITVLMGAGLSAVPDGQRSVTLAAVRAAKHALSQQAAVVVPMPGTNLAVVVNVDQVAVAAEPVFDRVAELAIEAVVIADLTLSQVDAVHLVGAAAGTPHAAQMISAKLGRDVRVAAEPGFVSVLGAAGAGPADGIPKPSGVPAQIRLPPLRRLFSLSLPGWASLLLYAHFVFTADFYNGIPASPRPGYYVLAAWGELTVACVLATVTFLQAASLLAALLDQDPYSGRARPVTPPRITRGLIVAAGAGAAVACLYAVTAAVYFGYPIAGLMRWALLPVLPIAACVVALAVLARRRDDAPPAGWDSFLAFPVSSVLCVTVGTFAVVLWWHAGMPWWANGWTDAVGYSGGLLMGAGIACALVSHVVVRVALTVLLGFLALIISRSGPDILAIIYAIAVAVWWAQRAGALARPAPASAPLLVR